MKFRILVAAMTLMMFAASLSAIPQNKSQRPNIILIALDQLHAGRLHSYGNPRETSPNLDRIAREGVLFKQFYASSPWTTPSYGSILTGQYPSKHGATLFHTADAPALKPGTTLLAESFKKGGYHTAAFINNSNGGAFLSRSGFDEYDEAQRRPTSITERSTLANPEYTAPATNERVETWLEQKHRGPFFLFLLYFEPHSPYNPTPEHDLFKSGSYQNEINEGYDRTRGHLFRQANLRDPQAKDRLLQLYDGKIHYIDFYIGQLFEKLRKTGLAQNTIVLITSDHGELVYSHSDDYLTFDHRSLYRQVLHVPGLLWGQGIPKGKVVNALASHVDIAPTLLALAGLPSQPDVQGENLVPLLKGQKDNVHRYIFSEQDVLEPLRSVQDERYKLIWNIETGRKQLYDYATDPEEQRDIAFEQPAVIDRLTQALVLWRKENDPDPVRRDSLWRRHSVLAGSELIVDEVTAGARFHLTSGKWKTVDGESFNGGGAYWIDPALPTDPIEQALWRADNPLLGKYRIFIWYGSIPGKSAATNIPLSVVTRKGKTQIILDQSVRIGEWRELGVFDDPLYVSILNQANGVIIADAVKFLRIE